MIAWMALLNRLPTLDRLAAWRLAVSGTCRLCQETMKTRDHFFFGCRYSREVWKAILQLYGLQRAVQDWNTKLNWAVKKLKGQSFISIILRVAWRVFVYFIWQERNQRMYNQRAKTISCLLKHIKSIVRLKLSKLKNIAEDLVNRSLCQSWGLNF